MRYQILVGLLGALAPVLLIAGPRGLAAEALSWDECVTQALEHNPDLVAARARINEAQAALRVTASAFSPQLSATANNGLSQRGGLGRTDSYTYSIGGTQLVYDGRKTVYSVRSASTNVLVSQYDYQVTSATVRDQLRAAFVALLKAQQLVTITAQIEKRRKEDVDQVTLRYDAGREHKGSLLTSQANLAQAQYEVQQARRLVALTQEQLAKAIGRAQPPDITAQGELAIHDYSKDVADFKALAAGTPFVRSLQAQEEAARFDLRSARATYYPEVSLSASVGMQDSQWPPSSSEWATGLSISIPLYEGGLRRAQVSRAQAALNLAAAQTASGYDQRRLALQQAWTDLVDAVESIAVQRKFLDAAEERSKIAEVEYANGLLSFDDWTIIEDQYVSALKAYLNAQASALTAEATWLEATGKTLEQ
jgi:outer membrane protein TolC